MAVLAPALLPAQILLPDGKGKEILDNSCQECHSLETIVQQSQSAAQWRRTVQLMARKGAVLTKQETDTLVDYLATYFGPEQVDLNKAGAAELARVLGLSAADIVLLQRYRAAGHTLANWGDLVKMDPALAKKLEPRRDSIAFH